MALVQTLDESLADLRAAELGPLAQAPEGPRDVETSSGGQTGDADVAEVGGAPRPAGENELDDLDVLC